MSQVSPEQHEPIVVHELSPHDQRWAAAEVAARQTQEILLQVEMLAERDDPLAVKLRERWTSDAWQAFAPVIEHTHAELYALAGRTSLSQGVNDERIAGEGLNEAYIKAFNGLTGFRGDAKLSTWMHIIVTRAVSTQATRERRHRHDYLDEVSEGQNARVLGGNTPGSNPSKDAIRHQAVGVLRAALDQLRSMRNSQGHPVIKDIDEKIIYLRALDVPVAEVAEEVGSTEGAVKVRHHRVLKKLKAVLAEMGIESVEDIY